MDRSNHYEAAFEAFLRERRQCYLAIDESRRPLTDDGPVKSLDFVVHVGGTRLLVDVKGRKFPGGDRERPRMVWQSWVSNEDIDGLDRWVGQFGAGYIGAFVFAYHIQPWVDLPAETPDLYLFRDQSYLFRAVLADDYRRWMKPRSPKWGTVDLPVTAFRQIVRPVSSLMAPVRVGSKTG